MSIKFSLSTSRGFRVRNPFTQLTYLLSLRLSYHRSPIVTSFFSLSKRVPLIDISKPLNVTLSGVHQEKKLWRWCCMTTCDVTAGEMKLINSVEINWLQEPSPAPLTTQWPWSQSISGASSCDDKQIKHARWWEINKIRRRWWWWWAAVWLLINEPLLRLPHFDRRASRARKKILKH